MIVRDLRPAHMRQYETVWVFETACSDGGAHCVDLRQPTRCRVCEAEAVERERRLPG